MKKPIALILCLLAIQNAFAAGQTVSSPAFTANIQQTNISQQTVAAAYDSETSTDKIIHLTLPATPATPTTAPPTPGGVGGLPAGTTSTSPPTQEPSKSKETAPADMFSAFASVLTWGAPTPYGKIEIWMAAVTLIAVVSIYYVRQYRATWMDRANRIDKHLPK